MKMKWLAWLAWLALMIGSTLAIWVGWNIMVRENYGGNYSAFFNGVFFAVGGIIGFILSLGIVIRTRFSGSSADKSKNSEFQS